ncbi:hypothetical protein FA15DRAFT_757239 [Coprinopsis marcescibilis]|uniref:Transmembrane protein n=1 Tax=Coprinopsis marcescibilis TaxID=230819 RepID=A0A5C3KS69_COPMA|nr:hypothetical protein FA15DRAFT_757239 [Coprinopsis marcescibilis]
MTSNRTATRWTVVDDADPAITFEGSWTEVSNDRFADVGVYGPAYLQGQHGTSSTGTVSFTFNGARVRLYGTNDVLNSSGVIDPSWTCDVDGIEYPPREAWRLPINNWAMCSVTLNTSGEHTFTLTATSEGTTFWVDYIEYIPNAALSATISPTVLIDDTDAAVRYLSGGWTAYEDETMMTLQPESTLSVTFVGTRIEWVGWYPSALPRGPSTGTYSIDGGSPVPFNIKGLASGSETLYGQVFFEVGGLSSGFHELFVKHNGPGAPLVLDYFRVEDGEILQPTLGGTQEVGLEEGREITIAGSTTGAGAGEKSNSSGTSVGAIVGGVLGGLAALGIIALLVWFFVFRKSRRNRESPPSDGSIPEKPATSILTGGSSSSPHGLHAGYEGAPLLLSTQSPAANATTFNTNPQNFIQANNSGGPNYQPSAQFVDATSQADRSSYSQPSPMSGTSHLTPLRRGMVAPADNYNVQQAHQFTDGSDAARGSYGQNFYPQR